MTCATVEGVYESHSDMARSPDPLAAANQSMRDCPVVDLVIKVVIRAVSS